MSRQDLERGLQDYLAGQSGATGDLATVVASRLGVEGRIRVAEKWWQRATVNREDPDLAYVCAYTALLDACAALLMSLGFRSRQSHTVPIYAASLALAVVDEGRAKSLREIGQRMRSERHRIQYEQTEVVSPKDMEVVMEEVPALLKALFGEATRRVAIAEGGRRTPG